MTILCIEKTQCANTSCGTTFETTNKQKKYCSAKCKNTAASRRARQRNPKKFLEYQRSWSAANREKLNEHQRQYREANREKVCGYERTYREANKEKIAESQRNYYETVTVPRGQRMQQRLWNLFQAQGLKDPSGLPELARRVLEWKPKGFCRETYYAKHPHGPLEYDWLWYAELNAEEAVVAYAE